MKRSLPVAVGGVLAVALARKGVRTVCRRALVLDGDAFREVPLRNLIAGARGLYGRYVRVEGSRPCDPRRLHNPFEGRLRSPTDPLVQVSSYHAMDRMCRTLKRLGYDLEAIQSSIHRGRYHPLRLAVNTTRVQNSVFCRTMDAYAFSRNEGLLRDVVVHEGGHGIWYHINPLFIGENFTLETAAIHEGASDAFAAILHGKPLFMASIQNTPSALRVAASRDLRNQHKLSRSVLEPHNRGEVYGGFFWSLHEKFLRDRRLTPLQATDLSLRLIVNHWFHYKTIRPKGIDFVDAVMSGAKALETARKMPLPFDDLEKMVLKEATRRRLMPLQGGRTVLTLPGMTAEQVCRMYAAKGPVRFRKIGGAPYPGGRTEIYQQQVRLPGLRTREGEPLTVDVVGHGFTVWHTEEGVRVSLQDVRPMKEGTIIEKIDQSPQEALDWLRRRLRRHLKLSEGRLRLSLGSRRLRLRQAAEAIRGRGNEVEMRLVALQGRPMLYYEIKLKTRTCYVAAYLRRYGGSLGHTMVFP